MQFNLSKLDDVAEIIDSLHKTPQYSESGYPMVRCTDVKYGRLNLEGTLRVSEDVFLEFSRRYKPKKDDIIITRVGSYGITSRVYDACFCLGQNTAAIVPKKINPEFLYFALNSPFIKRQIESAVVGSTQKTLSLKAIKELDIPRFNDDLEEEIAATLGALDDRIISLRETNATLESIAQALFKSWFIDFDPVKAKAEGREPEGMDADTAALFPSEFEASELGLIPKGWQAGIIQELCSRIESGGTPKRNEPSFWDGGIPWLTSSEVRSVIPLQTNEFITQSGLESSSAKLWPTWTTVIAMYGATAGEVCLLSSEMTANQACCGLIPKVAYRTYVFLIARRHSRVLAEKASGSAQQNLNKGLISNHPVLVPPASVAIRFDDVISPLVKHWVTNARHAETLAELRDTLLPKLMSGQLRLPEAETLVEQAA